MLTYLGDGNMHLNITSKTYNQGNSLRGINNKTVRREGFRRLHPLFTYLLNSITLGTFYKVTKWLKMAFFVGFFD
jgi:hypothetical protein